MTEEEHLRHDLLRHDLLQHCLRSLASAAPREASPELERRLRAKFRAQRNRRERHWNSLLAVAALLLVACGFYLLGSHSRVIHQRTPMVGAVDQATGFIALPYAQSDVPVEQAVIVRVNIPASALGAMGMPLNAPMPSEEIAADLLVGQDGIARAVRLVE